MPKAEIKKIERTDAEAKSADLVAGNIARLRELFPELITEGEAGVSVNVDVLKQLVGDKVVADADEKYGLNWHGKRAARQLALTPSLGTLRPCPEDSVDWETTQNLMIEGDNLEVLKLLQKSYAGKVKLIYIDPPYNTGQDFVYPDDFQDNIRNYLELTGQIKGGARTTSNTEASGRLHTDWMSMMYPRLLQANHLLRPDGTLFISIDDKEYSHLRTLCSEVFGEENQVGTVVWKNATDNNPTNIATEHEYILVVAKNRVALQSQWKSSVSDVKNVLVEKGQELCTRLNGAALIQAYEAWFREHKAQLWPLDRYKYIDAGGVYTGSQSVHNPGKEGYRYDVIHPKTKRPCKEPLMGYRFPSETMQELLAAGRILFGEDEEKIIELKVYAHEYEEKLSSVLDLDGRLGAYDLKEDFPEDGNVFRHTKPTRLLTTLFSFVLNQGEDIMLDFFAGSGTSGRAVHMLNAEDSIRRRFVLVQLQEPLNPEKKEQKHAAAFCDKLKKPRNIAELTKERLRRAGKQVKKDNPKWKGDTGFRVFKLDSSNIKAWDPSTDDVAKDIEKAIDHLKVDRNEADILYEMLLKLGLDLCVPTETKAFAGKQVHSIGGGVLMACLDKQIKRNEAEKLALGIAEWHKKLNPAGETTCVFRDSAFENDVAKTNLAAILNQHGITTIRSI